MDASEAEEFSEVASKPLSSLPYDSPGQTFVAFEKPEGVPAVGKFSNMLRFIVKEVLLPSHCLLCILFMSSVCSSYFWNLTWKLTMIQFVEVILTHTYKGVAF